MRCLPLSAVGAAAPRLVLALTSERAALEPARLAVHEFLLPLALSEQTLFNVELVLEETLMNVVWHAYGDVSGQRIGVLVQADPGQIVIEVDDDGIAFNPLQAANPARPASISEARPGGLGLVLVRQLAATLAYQRQDGRNCLRVSVTRG